MPRFNIPYPSFLREKSREGTLEGLLLGIVFFAALNGPAVIYFINFEGTQGILSPGSHWFFHLTGWLLAMLAWEIFFRAVLLQYLVRWFGTVPGFVIHLLVLNAVVIPALWPKAAASGLGILPFYLGENLFESFLAFYYLRTGSLASAVIFHGFANFVRFVVLNDRIGIMETYYVYSVPHGFFYFAALFVHAACAAGMAWTALRTGARIPGSPELK